MSVPRRTQKGPGPTGNELLDRLLAGEALAREITRVTLETEQELLIPGVMVSRVFFPTTSVCCILLALKSGQRAEVSTVGNEGFVGIPAVLRIPATEYAIVQIPGDAYVVNASALLGVLDENGGLRRIVNRYIGYAYQSAQQTTICNSYHSVEQRLARWLLTAHDRARTDVFPMTQELLSHMVAATRPRVNEAARRLRSDGMIDYERGSVQIRSRNRLERRACECYAATRRPAPAER